MGASTGRPRSLASVDESRNSGDQCPVFRNSPHEAAEELGRAVSRRTILAVRVGRVLQLWHQTGTVWKCESFHEPILWPTSRGSGNRRIARSRSNLGRDGFSIEG